MARRGYKSRMSSAQRDVNNIANSLLSPVTPATPVTDYSTDDDRRLWHPDPNRGAVTFGGRWARVVVHARPVIARGKPIYSWRGLPVALQAPVGLKFESPFNVVKCVRRKVRRSVIFALNKQRKGAGARHRRRDKYTGVKC